MEKTKNSPKISLSVVVSALNDDVLSYHLEANEHERQVLAERFEIPHIDFLICDLKISHHNWVEVVGQIQAKMQRESVVSLKIFDAEMRADFESFYSENPPQHSDEVIDQIKNGRLDLGDIISEQFGLNLEPFPRAPDETEIFEYHEDLIEPENPFKKLGEKMKK